VWKQAGYERQLDRRDCVCSESGVAVTSLWRGACVGRCASRLYVPRDQPPADNNYLYRAATTAAAAAAAAGPGPAADAISFRWDCMPANQWFLRPTRDCPQPPWAQLGQLSPWKLLNFRTRILFIAFVHNITVSPLHTCICGLLLKTRHCSWSRCVM